MVGKKLGENVRGGVGERNGNLLGLFVGNPDGILVGDSLGLLNDVVESTVGAVEGVTLDVPVGI